MKLIPITPIDLFKIREVLEDSEVFLKENNYGSADDFTNQIFLEEIPGSPKFYSIEKGGSHLGFVKVCEQFPLPGFLYIRLLVLRENERGKGLGSKVISELKNLSKGSLWIDINSDEASLPFWKSRGFEEEVGRWVLN